MKKKVRKFTKNDISEPLGELKHLAHISTRYFTWATTGKKITVNPEDL